MSEGDTLLERYSKNFGPLSLHIVFVKGQQYKFWINDCEIPKFSEDIQFMTILNMKSNDFTCVVFSYLSAFPT